MSNQVTSAAPVSKPAENEDEVEGDEEVTRVKLSLEVTSSHHHLSRVERKEVHIRVRAPWQKAMPKDGIATLEDVV